MGFVPQQQQPRLAVHDILKRQKRSGGEGGELRGGGGRTSRPTFFLCSEFLSPGCVRFLFSSFQTKYLSLIRLSHLLHFSFLAAAEMAPSFAQCQYWLALCGLLNFGYAAVTNYKRRSRRGVGDKKPENPSQRWQPGLPPLNGLRPQLSHWMHAWPPKTE